MSSGTDNPFSAHIASRDGNENHVKVFLSKDECDLSISDDHGFTCLHWACYGGHMKLVEMLLKKDSDVNVYNCGGDTPLHIAVTRGHRNIAMKLIDVGADINVINEHGNTPLHYACFWRNSELASELVEKGALVMMVNKYDKTPLETTSRFLADELRDKAVEGGQIVNVRLLFKPTKVVTAVKGSAAMLSAIGPLLIDIKDINIFDSIGKGHSGEVFQSMWHAKGDVNVVVKRMTLKGQLTFAQTKTTKAELERLRQLHHKNLIPLLGADISLHGIDLVSPMYTHGSLDRAITVMQWDYKQSLRAAADIANAMLYLHEQTPIFDKFQLKGSSIMVDRDLSVKIQLADCGLSVTENSLQDFSPQWTAPEILRGCSLMSRDKLSADVYSFAIILTHLISGKKPYVNLTPMQIGMRVAMEGYRPMVPLNAPEYICTLIQLCWDDDSLKRPLFMQIIPVLEKGFK